MSEKQLQQPKRWLVPFPEKKAITGHPCQDACNANPKMGQLLNYFLYEASWELEWQGLDESCKVVKFTRSHEHILKRVKISEKSLITFLKQFNTWGFVLSEPYSKEFTVQAEPIHKAMYTSIFIKKVRQKSCTSTSEENAPSDEVIESCKVYFLQENPEAIETLQLYNFALEARIQALSEALEQESCKVVKLQENAYSLQLYNFTLNTWIDAVSHALKIPSPIDSSREENTRDRSRESSASSLPLNAASSSVLPELDEGHIDLSLMPEGEIVESTSEQTNTTTSASSLSFDAAPSSLPQSENNSHITDSNIPLEGGSDALVDSHSLPNTDRTGYALARGGLAVGEVPSGKEQEEIDDPEATVPRMRAVTPSKQTPSLSSAVEPGRSGGPTPVAPASLPGDTSHEQNRDATPPRSVAVEVDSGCTAPAPTPQVPPGVTPPRTMRATVVSPPPQVLVVSQQFTSVEDWEQAQKAFVEQLRGIWKTTTPDFKRQSGNWNTYRKQYLDRWLKANPEPTAESLLSPEERRIWQDWQTNYKRPIPLTASDKQALTMFLPINPTREELKAERGWLFSTDDPKKPWYRKIGVSLLDCAKNWGKWQSLQDQGMVEKPTTRTLTREELRRMPV